MSAFDLSITRRTFLLTGISALAAAADKHPRIRIATSGFIWQENVEEGIRTTARFGFHGIEPFRQHILRYLEKPAALKEQLDRAGISLVTCSNGGPMSVDFIDPSRTDQTIEDHFRFARDFIARFGCRHFKINLGRRPDSGPTSEQLKLMARTLNELGKRTADIGLRLAPHPHIWSPLERENELRQVMELTDPRWVYLVTDTAHLRLGGMDPVAIIREFYPRVAALHFKDTAPRFRDHKGPTPTREEHAKDILYKNLGAGGVDFPSILKLLRDRNYEGWITLDLDPPRPGEGTIDENLEINKRYLREKLRIDL